MIINNNAQRIFGVNSPNNYLKVDAVSKVKNIDKSKDTVALSEKAQDYALVRNALNDIPDIREDKVAALKSRIESGSYNASSKDLVNKLFSDL